MQPFKIPIKVLKDGRNQFGWSVGKEFFDAFENTEILAAELQVKACVLFDGFEAEVECEIEGSVTVQCDRCLDDLVIPIHTSFEDDELQGDLELDLSQDVYDFVCTALPMIKVHPDGECNEEITKYLSK